MNKFYENRSPSPKLQESIHKQKESYNPHLIEKREHENPLVNS